MKSNNTSIITSDFGDYGELNELLNEGLNTPWFVKFTPAVIVYSITFLLGFFGNILVIFSILYLKKLQSITNLFLLSLATADLLLIIICVPFKITEFFTNEWLFGPIMCKVYNYMQTFTAICSVINLTMMSLERYLAILHPLRAKYTCTRKRTKIIIFSIWLLSILAAIPVVFGKRAEKVGLHNQVYICVRKWSSLNWKIFEIYRSTIILFIPFFIMLFTYTKICVKLWKMPDSRRKLTENVSFQFTKPENEIDKDGSLKEIGKKIIRPVSIRSDDETTRKQIIKMLICIVAIFFISWSPITINHLLVSFDVLPNVNHGYLWYARLVFYAMSYINSCVNPVVYTFMSKNFREGFRHIISKAINCMTKEPKNEMETFKNIDNVQEPFEIKSSSESQEQTKSLICGTAKTQISTCI
ncbi:unnamed protein product [Brachionus calyciflorus]|uniref:G-protein coupled receptors family 1 profile domain-containing protein n=1 Tax=Brachionus calyciflorus TaxID=104777 RepID=A0A814DIN6_9BILA|nr:unnamed protein product [Brachionus calyciflorus]